MASPTMQCRHDELQVDVSPHAEAVGFERVSLVKRHAATTPSGSETKASRARVGVRPSTFPGPLVLPDDDLALSPRYPPQSLRSWVRLKGRNAVTDDRKTVYVACPPRITDKAAFMEGWLAPNTKGSRSERAKVELPKVEDVCKYLEAFYHGLTVRLLPHEFFFSTWESSSKPSAKAATEVGLCIGNTCTRVRARACPDRTFARQLNLNDVIDAELGALPADAYALVLLVHHDLYEDDDDDFCCGRAYGGSRVAVVSSARYHPSLDVATGIDHAHMWPASHCKAYVESVCSAVGNAGSKAKRIPSEPASRNSPLFAAVEAAGAARPPQADLHGLWLSRVVRTAAHELGHCFGMDHCVYYACVMQGTAGMVEDVRQPPYLCPVCLKKLTRAVLEARADRDERAEMEYVRERCVALARVCTIWSAVGMFAGFGAWLSGRLKELPGGPMTTEEH